MGRLTAPVLGQVLPAFAAELENALRAQGEEGLAAQISTLRISSLCQCDDDFCSSFHTGERAQTIWRGGRQRITPGLSEGMVILEVVDGKILFVEVLDRVSIRDALARAFRGSR